MKVVLLAMLLGAGALVVAPTAAAGPECYDVYNEWTVGPVTVVQRSSCHYEVCVERDCDWIQ